MKSKNPHERVSGLLALPLLVCGLGGCTAVIDALSNEESGAGGSGGGGGGAAYEDAGAVDAAPPGLDGAARSAILFTGGVDSLEVDSSGIYFSPTSATPHQIDICPLTGCGPTPAIAAAGLAESAFVLTNGSLGLLLPNPSPPFLGENLVVCSEAACSSDQQTLVAFSNREVTLDAPFASPHHLFWSWTNPAGAFLERCASPSASGCASVNSVTNFAPMPTPLVASDEVVYFLASFADGGSGTYSCPSDATDCTPTLMDIGAYTQLFARGDDLYFLSAPSGDIATIARCPSTGCPTSGPVPVVTTSKDAGEIAVDASGTYWTNGSSIQMCPAAGCYGAPRTVATTPGHPKMLRLSGGFVYWFDADDDTIRRAPEVPVLSEGITALR